MCSMPGPALLQKSIKRIAYQILCLQLRIDVDCITLPGEPAYMCVVQAEFRRMRIERRIDITVVRAMNGRPPDWRALEGEVTEHYPEILNRLRAGKRSMRQQAMITDGHTQGMQHITD